ncbi:hypothetical protein GS464_24585 [Rhodococcus hoagii]|nr:hypothetical protein [Prescottella equi]
MTDQFHITATQMRALVALLGEIPALIDDLAITLTRQDCIGAGGIRVTGGSDEQPLPINLAASDAHDLLHSTLASWARHIYESRGQGYTGPRSTVGLSSWLAANVTRLAMTEGCEEAHDEIEHAMSQCRRVCDRPEDRAVLATDPYGEAIVYGLELNAKECADIARTSGVEGLTKRRVLYLLEVEAVKPLRTEKVGKYDSPVLRLGEVVDAHKRRLERDTA